MSFFFGNSRCPLHKRCPKSNYRSKYRGMTLQHLIHLNHLARVNRRLFVKMNGIKNQYL